MQKIEGGGKTGTELPGEGVNNGEGGAERKERKKGESAYGGKEGRLTHDARQKNEGTFHAEKAEITKNHRRQRHC